MEATEPTARRDRVELEKVDVVLRRTGLSTSSLYAAVARGEFPRPLKITAKAVAWRVDEVNAWIEARPRATAGRAPRKREPEVAV